MQTIEFYFDLGSPYSYIGFHRIQKIAADRHANILWKPMLLGGVFKATGNSSPMIVSAKAQYAMKDLKRWSKLWQIPMQMNPYFPINTLQLMRLVTAVQIYQPEQFLRELTGVFHAMFGEPRNLNDLQEFKKMLIDLDLDVQQVQDWLEDEQVKQQLKSVTEEAVQRGVFGAPTWFSQNEMYWGIDHLYFLEHALTSA